MKLFLRGGVWWYSHGGGENRIRQSTGCKDKAEAMEKARQLAMIATMRDDAERIEAAAALAAVKRRQADVMQASSIRLADCWEMSPHCGRDGETLKPSVVHAAHLFWQRFCRYADSRGMATASEITPAVAMAFLHREGRNTVKMFCVFRAMFRRLGITPNPFSTLPRQHHVITHREPLTREQIASLLQVAGKAGGEYPSYIRFLLYTGLRMGDAATCRAEQIDWETGVLSRVMEKTSKPVTFPLHPELMKRLSPGAGYLFPQLAQKYSSNPTCISKDVKKLLTDAGIVGEANQYCAHCLRTTFASICAEADVPLPVIQSWLGHSSPTVTRVYARIEDMRAKRAALARFPSLG